MGRIKLNRMTFMVETQADEFTGAQPTGDIYGIMPLTKIEDDRYLVVAVQLPKTRVGKVMVVSKGLVLRHNIKTLAEAMAVRETIVGESGFEEVA